MSVLLGFKLGAKTDLLPNAPIPAVELHNFVYVVLKTMVADIASCIVATGLKPRLVLFLGRWGGVFELIADAGTAEGQDHNTHSTIVPTLGVHPRDHGIEHKF